MPVRPSLLATRRRRGLPRLAAASALAGAALLFAPAPARADVVHLLNGQRIEGRVTETADAIRVEVAFGRMTVDRRDVLRIERRPLAAEVYEERLAALDRQDPAAVRALARWCEQNRLPEEAAALFEQARQAELSARVEATDPTDPEALLRLAAWARAAGYPDGVERELLGMVTAVAPDHDEARALLGHERFRGAWMPATEVAEVLREEEAREMRARGLVLHDGAWVTPEEARVRLAEAQLALAREALAREAEQLRAEREQLAALRAELERRFAGLDAERAELTALRVELANERRALEDLLARNRYASGVPVLIGRRRVVEPCDPPAPRTVVVPPLRRVQPPARSAPATGIRVRIGR